MSGWAGFSEEELRRMQQKDSVIASQSKLRPPSRNRQQLQRKKTLERAAQACAGFMSLELPPEQQLNKMPSKGEHDLEHIAPGSPSEKSNAQETLIEEKTQDNCKEAAEKRTLVVKELEKQEVELREKNRLEQLQREQKIIEERNKRKKALLAKTIAEKSKQTQAEAVKLNRIQNELQALDEMVSSDIGILRGKIEQASWDYTTARKRYDKAETEYVVAKLELQKKTDMKEQLTEHLCAIIQQNELRKAVKLEELMQQLQLEATEEELGRQNVEDNNVRSFELQGRVKVQHGVSESQEATVQWTCTEEESQKKDDGLQLEHQLSDEFQPEQNFKAEVKKCRQDQQLAQT
ncbi:RAB6-interacting golgin isoform X1 [Hippocampus zosterae]|uniref:RAB6-interacting golgin isoform X1 n=2 Tax=Hippocampus zosterae TaxID=109293 RepID=UPI00223D31CA|nr:RAB6-interacting golgin isoform X1 [Hippocampus zosterae]